MISISPAELQIAVQLADIRRPLPSFHGRKSGHAYHRLEYISGRTAIFCTSDISLRLSAQLEVRGEDVPWVRALTSDKFEYLRFLTEGGSLSINVTSSRVLHLQKGHTLRNGQPATFSYPIFCLDVAHELYPIENCQTLVWSKIDLGLLRQTIRLLGPATQDRKENPPIVSFLPDSRAIVYRNHVWTQVRGVPLPLPLHFPSTDTARLATWLSIVETQSAANPTSGDDGESAGQPLMGAIAVRQTGSAESWCVIRTDDGKHTIEIILSPYRNQNEFPNHINDARPAFETIPNREQLRSLAGFFKGTRTHLIEFSVAKDNDQLRIALVGESGHELIGTLTTSGSRWLTEETQHTWSVRGADLFNAVQRHRGGELTLRYFQKERTQVLSSSITHRSSANTVKIDTMLRIKVNDSHNETA